MNTGRAALLVLAAAVLFGTTGTAQALGPTGLDPLTVGSARVVLAGAVLLGLAALRGAFRNVPRASWPLVLIGAVGVAVYQVGFFSGVSMAGVAVGTITALGSCPVWTGLVQWLVTGQRPGGTWLAATGLAVAGVGTLVLSSPGTGGSGSDAVLGAVLALAAGLGYAIYTVCAAKMISAGQRSDGTMGLLFAAGGLALLPVLLWRFPGGLDGGDPAWLSGLGVIGYLVLVPTVLAYLLFGAGLRVLPAANVATLNLAEPVVAALLGELVLGEPFTGGGVLGALLVLAGLGLLALPRKEKRREPVAPAA
ncbi:DMT family transporter [Crossiella cryophila]|uniref:DME family drug/metabolite transporter n=1 Tax=Crossiella cryophila TaxID=43355 RepID=A0A7W7C824_9PSEU|nr:EamA family transporter [Crossiella cryophila]MBB4676243.1 DME family drug/metabolite transporter [Crossiella cryophila]